MKNCFLAIVLGATFVLLPGCATTLSSGFVDTSVEGVPVNDSYAYVDAGVSVVIDNPYDYYYYDNGLVYHYDYYSPTRIVVVDQPPMGLRIHRHRIMDNYYTSHPPSLWRYQQHERQSLPGGPHH